ncbi:hypothetical protein KL908_005411, partial [Ogataea polymorpha]
PVLYQNEIQFVVAAKAHHSKIDGSSPGYPCCMQERPEKKEWTLKVWKMVQDGSKLDHDALGYNFSKAWGYDRPQFWIWRRT